VFKVEYNNLVQVPALSFIYNSENIPGGKGRRAREADNLTAICEPIVQKMWEPRRLTTLWASTARYSDTFIFIYQLI
jgi:hypothetical protein